MVICEHCNVPMKYVMRFEQGKSFRLRKCPKCYYETRQSPLIFEDEETTQQSRSKKGEHKSR